MFCFSTVLQFWVQGPTGPVPASSLVVLLRKQLLRDKSDFLLFKVLRVDTVGKFWSRPVRVHGLERDHPEPPRTVREHVSAGQVLMDPLAGSPGKVQPKDE